MTLGLSVAAGDHSQCTYLQHCSDMKPRMFNFKPTPKVIRDLAVKSL